MSIVINENEENSCINLFFKTNTNDLNSKYLINLLNESWDESSSDTLKLIFYIRDTYGKRDIFIRCMKWLRVKHTEIFYKYLFDIPEYGRYLDLFELCDEKETKDIIIKKIAQQLKEEKESGNYTLLVKWIPTEHCKWDRLYNITSLIAKELNINCKTLRKEYLTPMRKKLNITESIIPEWDKINYNIIPNLCMKKLRSAFCRNDNIRFMNYLENVNKKNKYHLLPHQIIEKYIYSDKIDPELETMWDITVKKIKETGVLKNVITVCDISGSMYGIPLANSIALGLLTAEINEGIFSNKIITFSETPTLFTIKGNTLYDKIKHILNASWGENINLQNTLDLIIKEHITLLILTDMPYKFNDIKYDTSTIKIIYWNLKNSFIDFSISNINLISGFHTNIINTLIECGDINPYTIMRNAIDIPRYSRFIV